MKKQSKVLYIDIETAPMKAFIWRLYGDMSISWSSQTEKDWYMMSFSYAWGD